MFEVIEFAPVFVSYTNLKHTNKECIICKKAFIENDEENKKSNNNKYYIIDNNLVHLSCFYTLNKN